MSDGGTSSRLPLDGVVVLDLGVIVSAPLAARTLQDLGATVIKVESLDGDPLRGGPATRGRRRFNFLSLNRGRQSVAVNLKHEEGRATVHRLVERADVVIENFRPGVAQRLGVDADTLRVLKPSLIHCTITGFPDESPRSGRPVTDGVMQAYCGVLELTGHGGSTGSPVPIIVADAVAGANAAHAILAALIRRDRSGEGAHVKVSMFEGLLSWLHLTANLSTSHGPPSTCKFRTLDGKEILVQPVLHFFPAFARVVDARAGCPELLTDDRFATPEARAEHLEPLMHLLNDAFARRTSDDWLAALAEASVPAGPIQSLVDALLSDESKAIEVKLDEDVMMMPGSPYLIDGMRATSSPSAPALGENSDEILTSAGFDALQISQLRAAGAVR